MSATTKEPSRVASRLSRHSLATMEIMEIAGKFEPLRLLHRLLVFGIALWYVVISVEAFLTSVTVLRGYETKDLGTTVHQAELITGYAGRSTINKSPLVQSVLSGSTEPRNDTIYLETESTHSFTGCSIFEGSDSSVYSNTFTRFLFTSLQHHAADNLTYLQELELIAPVVDCTFDLLMSSDEEVTQLRVYYLTRWNSTNDTLLLSTSMSTQDFEVTQQYQSGAALLATIAAIDDMQATQVTHNFALAFNYPYEEYPQFTSCELIRVEDDNYWLFNSLPRADSVDPAKEVRTAYRTGGYIDDPVAQSNFEIVHWDLPNDPATELTDWKWHAFASLRDSWAWTHSIHGIFALVVLFDLGVLLFVIYQRVRKGHFWVGDAFATISNSLLYRGVLIFLSNHFNGYWTLTEMCLAIGHDIGGRRPIHYRPELAHADLLTFFMNVTSVLSYLFRERIDPMLAFAAFELGFAYRVELVHAIPALRKIVVNFAENDYWLGLINVSPFLERLSPMKFWTIHPITADRKLVVMSTVVCIFSTMCWLVVYIIARKAFRYMTGGSDAAKRRSSRYVAKEDDASVQDGLTSFETATGAALRKRYGVISGYDNYAIRDSKRYASIDAVYGNGYLAANSKFLVATEDIFSLLVMKLTRVRFTNIYVYSILADGGVNQTAQLVYPHTIPWHDLAHLGVMKLS
ncbi:Glycerol-3-phosphate dehydrogenase [Phytophthora cinnamomi]|uniref:Glycerol-3-phosphate dehydrogenase n=1 Tax=Phytophthora cinnamomi TaxID=4785 RepID=UPI0035597DF9|nr:Glycerol-3-phosphate dehydrogenase [Phytophthora cinnamomi]